MVLLFFHSKLTVRQVQIQVKEVVLCTRNEVVRQKPELEKESDIEPVVLDCGFFHRLTGCCEYEGDEESIELS